jgi:hypothetical protein
VNTTTLVILATALVLGIYDIFIGVKYGSEATISYDLWQGSCRWPTIPFAFGYLCGHLFAQMRVTN